MPEVVMVRPRRRSLYSCLLGVIAAACGDAASQPASVNPDAGSSQVVDAGSPPLLAAPATGHGVQFHMTTEIAASEESERCQFVTTGEDALLVNHDEARFSTGSHHVLLFMTSYKEIPSRDQQGNDVDTSGVFDCSAGVQGFWSVAGLVSASQSPQGDSAISLPDGVAVRIPANSVLLINAHYINTSARVLTPDVYINLHTIPESELEQEGGLLFWYNPFLKAPANGRSTMTSSCPIPTDITITNAQSHMHKRGVGYAATIIAPNAERNELYTGHDWEDVPVVAFDPDVQVSAGSRIEWTCDYQNDEAHDVYQGPRSTDEMCMFLGSYYPRNDAIGFCTRGRTPFMGAEWNIGTGDASCAQSFQCIVDANTKYGTTGSSMNARQSLYAGITECLIASRPSVSHVLSDMLGCLAVAPSTAAAVELCSSQISTCQSQ